jgi:two-component system sensor histidine kinase CpxA
MRCLILKIFLCYWLAAGLVLLVTDLGPHQQLHRPEATAAIASALRLQGRILASAYERGGCGAVGSLSEGRGDRIYLADVDGTVLCGDSPGPDLRPLSSKALASRVPEASSFRDFQIVALTFKSASGKPYTALLKSAFTSKIQAWGFAVGPTTMWISAGVTILLGILVAMPIRRLRVAARRIANGRLHTRIRLGWTSRFKPRWLGEDVLSGLAVDFNHMADRLEFLADAQRTLFRDISHELRSPLARLSVALELAREAGAPSMKAPLDRIENEAARVNDLVGQLLTLSHMESMQGLSGEADLSLRDLVECLLPDLEYEAAGRRRRLLASDIQDCTVSGDPVMLQRAFENVVRNAICHSPEQGVIEIGLQRIERDGLKFGVLRIADSGPGVPADELQSILLPFYRADKSRQSSTGGFGVGLAIANRAVKLHRGQIAIRNRPEGGLVVEMSFPLAAARQPAAEVREFAGQSLDSAV